MITTGQGLQELAAIVSVLFSCFISLFITHSPLPFHNERSSVLHVCYVIIPPQFLQEEKACEGSFLKSRSPQCTPAYPPPPSPSSLHHSAQGGPLQEAQGNHSIISASEKRRISIFTGEKNQRQDIDTYSSTPWEEGQSGDIIQANLHTEDYGMLKV